MGSLWVRRSGRQAIVMVCASLLGAHLASAQEFTPLFDGKSLKGWKAEGTRASVDKGVLTVHPGRGWVRTNRVLGNFIMTLEMRPIEPTTTVQLFVRSWPTFDRKTNSPNNAYSVNVTSEQSPDADAEAPAAWRRFEITCVDRNLEVRIDDKVVHTAENVGNPQGHIGLAVPRGRAEFRRIEFREKPGSSAQSGGEADVFEPSKDGVTLPTPLREVKPQYTQAAMEAKIVGTVLLAAVVRADGTVGKVTVLNSLDPYYGLDQAAIEAARQWRFRPGTKDGVPVAVRVTIELKFIFK